MYPLLLILALAALAAVTLKWLLLRRGVANMTETIHRIHGRHTNERVTVSTGDRALTELAAAINLLYEDVYRERGEHAHAMEDLRRSMAGISHDLRTPLTSILGYVGLLRGGKNTPEQAERYLEVVHRKASALNRMIQNLFELARLEAGAYRFELVQVDAGELLAEELAGFYAEFSAAGQQPVLELAPDPLPIVGDAYALSRVFGNLLKNMLQHGGREIRISGERRDGEVVLSFSNRAEGLVQRDVDNLFRRFYVADPTRSRESTGLGLSIAREFVEQMGGGISAVLEDGVLAIRIVFPESR